MSTVCLNLSEANWAGSGIAEYERRISNLLARQFPTRGVTYRDKVFAAPFPVTNSLVPVRYCFERRFAKCLPVPFHWITGRIWADDVYIFFRNEIPYQKISGKVIAVVHDLIPLRISKIQSAMDNYRERIMRVLERADVVVTVSDFSRQDIASEFGYDARRIAVVPPGVDVNEFASAESRSVDKLKGLSVPMIGDYLLYFGSQAPQKNLPVLLRGYAALAEDLRLRHPLVLNGCGDEFSDMIIRLGIAKNIHFLGSIPINAKVALYHHARAFAFLSSYEGFGMPLIEAMAAGCPVVCSNRASLPEVAGEAALVVDPDDSVAVASALTRVLEDNDVREHLISDGLARARQFTWEGSVEKMAEIIRHVMVQ